jgi:hypothetical protein
MCRFNVVGHEIESRKGESGRQRVRCIRIRGWRASWWCGSRQTGGGCIILLFGHRQLEAIGKRCLVLADECGQTLRQMEVLATVGIQCPASGHLRLQRR